MAISFVNVGAEDFQINNNTGGFPSAIAAGDMLVLLVGGKPYDAGVSLDNGAWLRIGATRFTDGTTAAGTDAGSMFVEAWWKEYDGSESEPQLQEGSPTWNVTGQIFYAFRKDVSETWATPVIVGGGDATAGTGFSVTAGSNPGIVTGDHTLSFAAFRSDAATPCSSHLTPTATGVTFTNTHDPATDPENTAGGDMGMCITRSTVSGTASAAPVLAATLAAAHTGAAALIRLRVAAGAVTGSFAANAVIKSTRTGSTTLNAVIKKTGLAGSSTANAVLGKTFAGSTTANAIILRTQTPSSASYASDTLANGDLVAYWRLGEPSGTTANDETGNYDGTYVGTPTLGVAGLIADADTAITLNGDDWVTCGNPAALQLTSGSVECWFATTSPGASYRALVTKQFAFGLFLQDGVLGFYDWTAGGTFSSTGLSPTDGVRHHVVMAFQSGVSNGTKVYLDGSLVLTGTMTVVNQTDTVEIGDNAEVQQFNGTIDEVAIYSAVKDATWAAAHNILGITSGVTVDAVISAIPFTGGSFTANAVIRREQTGSLTVNAVRKATGTSSLTADAVVKRNITGTTTASAVLAKTLASSATANAIVKATRTGSATASAVIKGTIAASFGVDAFVPGAVGDITWTTPGDGVQILASPTLVFLTPTPVLGDMHFEIQIDTDSGFPAPISYRSWSDQTGWEYFDGGSWVPIPQSGMPAGFAGNEARYTVQSTLPNGFYYRRVRAGFI